MSDLGATQNRFPCFSSIPEMGIAPNWSESQRCKFGKNFIIFDGPCVGYKTEHMFSPSLCNLTATEKMLFYSSDDLDLLQLTISAVINQILITHTAPQIMNRFIYSPTVSMKLLFILIAKFI